MFWWASNIARSALYVQHRTLTCSASKLRHNSTLLPLPHGLSMTVLCLRVCYRETQKYSHHFILLVSEP
jgi:hypothetical protein